MRFSFVAKHRGIWPVSWIFEALGVSRSGFHAWFNRSPSRRAQYDEVLVAGIRSSFAGSDRTYGARRVWHDVLAEARCWSAPHRATDAQRRSAGSSSPAWLAQGCGTAPRGLAQHPGSGVRGVGAEPEVDRRLYLHLDSPGLALCGGSRRPLFPPGGGLVDEFIDGLATGDRCADHGDLASWQARQPAAPLRSRQPNVHPSSSSA